MTDVTQFLVVNKHLIHPRLCLVKRQARIGMAGNHFPIFVSAAEELIQSWLTGVDDSGTPRTLCTGSHGSSERAWAGEYPMTTSQRAVEKIHKQRFHKGTFLLNMYLFAIHVTMVTGIAM